MSSIILQAHSLTKKYRHTVALDHIDLQIEKGKIYGFIGQNGAGKTTFLRLVTGLAFLTSGTLDLWGKSSAKDLQEQRKRIGCMIETPALFPAMTAYQNMEIQRIQRGIPDKAVIEKTLNMVGLKDTGKKSVRNFSLGMRQRLGIAIALLNTPEFLILDEPINGLDPAGIVEVRNLLKSLNKEYGMTILVSSHILEELYQTATEFILIDKGKIIEEISDQELNERCKRHIAIKATDPQKALLVLEEKLHTENFKLLPDGTIRLYDYLDDLEKVAAVLSDAHILVTGLSVSGDTLEDYFLSKIGGSENVKCPDIQSEVGNHRRNLDHRDIWHRTPFLERCLSRLDPERSRSCKSNRMFSPRHQLRSKKRTFPERPPVGTAVGRTSSANVCALRELHRKDTENSCRTAI